MLRTWEVRDGRLFVTVGAREGCDCDIHYAACSLGHLVDNTLTDLVKEVTRTIDKWEAAPCPFSISS